MGFKPHRHFYIDKLKLVRNIKNKPFGLFPAKTRVCDRLSEDVVANTLCTVLNIAFYHKSLDKLLDIIILASAEYYVLGNTHLLKIFLS